MDKNKPKIKYPEVKVSDVFRIFWQASKPNSSSLVLSLLGVTAGTLVVIATPIYYKKFFDLLIATGDKAQIVPQLIHIILVVLSLNGLLWIGYRVSGFASNQFQTKVIARLKQVAFDSMIGHAYSFFANNFTGALVQRVNRFANAFERLADRLTFDILSIFIRIVGITAVVWTIKPVFAGLILTWVGFFLLFNYFFAIWKLKYDVKRAASDSATTAVLSDAITNHNTIQLFNGHDQE